MKNQLQVPEAAMMELVTASKQAGDLQKVAYLKVLGNWSNSEVTIYQARQTGMQFLKLNEKQKAVSITTMLMEISVISGCPLPSNQLHYQMLETELTKFFNENSSLSQLTFDEVITAFRFNSLGTLWEKVKHWQNPINLDYVGEVLKNWGSHSRSVKVKAEDELLDKNLYDRGQDETLTDQQIIDQAISNFTTSGDYMEIEARAFDILNTMGLLNPTEDQRQRIRTQAREKADYIARKINSYHLNDADIISRISKKIAAAEYFNGREVASKFSKPNTDTRMLKMVL